MSLPYQIADRVEFETMLCQGLDKGIPVAQGNEPLDNVLDVLIRSDPLNASDAADQSTWIFIGNSTYQPFPLRANESINLRVVSRRDIYYRGPTGHKIHVVTAKINANRC